MLRRSVPAFTCLLLLAGGAASAETRWVDQAEMKERFGVTVGDQTGPPGKGYWAGHVDAVEVSDTEEGERMTGRVKVTITWRTDRTDYECHNTYVMQMEDMEDFTHRSIALTKCR